MEKYQDGILLTIKLINFNKIIFLRCRVVDATENII